MQIYADPITVNCRKVLAGLRPEHLTVAHGG